MKLEIDHLVKSYGSQKAVDDLSLSLENGIYGLLGPNGAGKSTLMQILTGNLKADSGRIFLDGTDIRKMGKEYRKCLGYMPQEQICYPQFTLMEFLQYMAILKDQNPRSKETKEQIEEILEEVHLENDTAKKLGAFSGGMQRRAILAQAMLGSPSVLILDEPTAGLDPHERIAMRNMIAKMSQDRIVLLATHIAGDVECIANRIILMKKGRLVVEDTPRALMDRVSNHVRTVYCSNEEFAALQEKNCVGNYVQTPQGLAIHLITKEEQKNHPSAGADCMAGHLTEEPAGLSSASLDEVYLYYCEVK